MKTTIIAILFLAAAVGGWMFYKHRNSDPVQYQTVCATRGELTQIVTATGTLNPVTNVQLGSQISGNIAKLYADFNSSVKAGQLVAEIDPAIYQAIVHQCEGDLASAKAALELAKLTENRKRELVAQHAAAPADLDNATATLHQAEATVLMKQANLEKSKVDLDHCKVFSPIDGTVISRAVDVGQTVAAAMNAPVLFTVAKDLTAMQIDSAVAEADVGVIDVGQDVDFSVDAFPYRTFHGKVAQVRNAATTVQNVVTYDVVISVKNDDLKLKPGMTTNISVIVAHRDEVLKLSNAALRYRPPELQPSTPMSGMRPGGPGGGFGGPGGGGGGSGRPPGAGHGGHGTRMDRTIYVLSKATNKPEPVQIKVGITDGISTEITEGLREGDPIVVSQTGGADPSKGSQPSNPLSGGMRFR